MIPSRASAALSAIALLALSAEAARYSVSFSRSPRPLLSSTDGTSKFVQAFNPTWVPASAATSGRSGLLVRSQNCSSEPGGACVHCSGEGEKASVLAFSALSGQDGASVEQPQLAPIGREEVVLRAGEMADQRDLYGVEDPRLVYDANASLYLVFHTCYGPGTVCLCLATARDPTREGEQGGWRRLGAVFGWGAGGSKSAALLLNAAPSGKHLLFWGAGSIRVATSSDPLNWGTKWDTPVWLAPIAGSSWESTGVESGPAPLRLSTGDFFFIYNAWDKDNVYRPGWVVLSKDDPTVIVQRSEQPMCEPTEAWEKGAAPYTCNVKDVIFIEAAHETEKPDVFRVYYGAADASIASGLISVAVSP